MAYPVLVLNLVVVFFVVISFFRNSTDALATRIGLIFLSLSTILAYFSRYFALGIIYFAYAEIWRNAQILAEMKVFNIIIPFFFIFFLFFF
jgi:hypothetical protein